jgi:hypothetical protein
MPVKIALAKLAVGIAQKPSLLPSSNTNERQNALIAIASSSQSSLSLL